MHTRKRSRRIYLPIFAALSLVSVFFATVAFAANPGVDPSSVSISLNPGASSAPITKTVHTPPIPPNPDIVFLADTTGSMGPALANVKAGASTIMGTVLAAQPTAEFGVASYKDFNCDSVPFSLDLPITAPAPGPDTTVIQNAINTWSAGGGCDTPESQLNALYQLATDPTVGFRTGSSRIIVWFGDSSGHDPSNGISLAAAIAALQTENIRVIAVPVNSGLGDGLDNTGQATAITSATGGLLLPSATPGQVSTAILAGLSNLPATVAVGTITCSDPSVSVGFTLTSASDTVTSGGDVTYDEVISASSSAPQGSTINCTVDFTINGLPAGPDFTQSIAVTINDVTPPTASCTATTNPSGKNIPKAGTGTGNSGQNPDGFYLITAADNVGVASVVIKDSGSSFVSNPFATGDKVKIVQVPGGTPSDTRPGPGGITSLLKLNGDATLVVTDTSGNVTTASCLVPPPPK